MMLFKNHKKGFVFIEVLIALAVVGILLTAILQLQLSVSQRIVFNLQTSEHLLELKKDLYHFLMNDSNHKKEESASSLQKIEVSSLKKYQRLQPYKIKKEWHAFIHKKEALLMFLGIAPEKKDEK